MNSFLLALAKEILKNIPEGVGKVKFAKIIYFVYKGLLQKNLIKIETANFIRMPLGPVPNGFMSLFQYKEFRIEEKHNNGLSYNSQIYYISNPSVSTNFKEDLINEIKLLTDQFNKFKTYELVEFSHQEPSWKRYPNGTIYNIEPEDLEIKLPKKNLFSGIFKSEVINEDGRLQEQLVDGLIEDIVEESTTLEYPENG